MEPTEQLDGIPIAEEQEDLRGTPIFVNNEPFPRAFRNRREAETNFDNPEGFLLNIGEWVDVGAIDPRDVAKAAGFSVPEIMQHYIRCEAPHFRHGHDMTQGLWQFPQGDILITTWYYEIPPAARSWGVHELPCTTIRAIPHCRTRQEEEAAGLDWVLSR
jgi:hypothetical protein